MNSNISICNRIRPTTKTTVCQNLSLFGVILGKSLVFSQDKLVVFEHPFQIVNYYWKCKNRIK